MRIVPITLKKANAFVKERHRHHSPTQGHKFSIGLSGEDGKLIGVVIVGRPVSRHLDDGTRSEVLRLCTDETRNACSMLYGAARKAAFAMGYDEIITYTLPEEGGASLRASGFLCEGEAGGGDWSRPSRSRKTDSPTCKKLRWKSRRGGQVNVS